MLLYKSYANSCPSNLSGETTALEKVYRSLGQRLDEYPESSCNSQQRCVSLVKGGNAALVRVYERKQLTSISKICFLTLIDEFVGHQLSCRYNRKGFPRQRE